MHPIRSQPQEPTRLRRFPLANLGNIATLLGRAVPHRSITRHDNMRLDSLGTRRQHGQPGAQNGIIIVRRQKKPALTLPVPVRKYFRRLLRGYHLIETAAIEPEPIRHISLSPEAVRTKSNAAQSQLENATKLNP